MKRGKVVVSALMTAAVGLVLKGVLIGHVIPAVNTNFPKLLFLPTTLVALTNVLISGGVLVLLAITPFARPIVLAVLEPLSGAIDERVQRLVSEQSDRDFVTAITAPEHLRRYDRNVLRRAGDALRTAAYPAFVPREARSLLDKIDEQTSNLTLWRGEFKVALKYRHSERSAVRPFATLDSILSWTYVNHSGRLEDIDLKVEEIADTIPGIPDDELYKMHSLRANGRDCSVQLTSQREGEAVVFRAGCKLDVPSSQGSAGNVRLEREATLLQPRYKPFVLSLFMPVNDLKLEIDHPENVASTVYVFGINTGDMRADPLQRAGGNRTFSHYDYQGWLLADHGLIVMFSDQPIQNQPEMRSPV